MNAERTPFDVLPPQAKQSRAGGCFAYGFVGFWCLITFTADAVLLVGLAGLLGSQTFAETTGTITHCSVEAKSDGEGGTSYTLHVGYTYTVEGRAYSNDRYRFGSTSFGPQTLHRLRAKLRPGTTVPVHYFPADPGVAALDTDLHGIDLFFPWFLTPFNVIAVGGLVYLLRGDRPAFVPDDPRVIATTDAGWQYRPGGRDWWGYFGVTMLVVTFVGCFAIGFTAGFNPPVWVMLVAWPTALGFAAWVAGRLKVRVALEVDDFQKTLTLPRRREGSLTVPLSEVTGFSVEEEVKTDSDGDKTTVYHVLLRWGEPQQTARFHNCGTREAAESVAAWLDRAVKRGGSTPPTP